MKVALNQKKAIIVIVVIKLIVVNLLKQRNKMTVTMSLKKAAVMNTKLTANK